MLKRHFCLLVLTSAISVTAWAQYDLGSVVGIVTDPNGLVVSNATVAVQSLFCNVLVRQSVTSSSGGFDFVALQPGSYQITVKQRGFRDTTQGFTLAVSQRLQLNIALEVGSASQQVMVNAEVENLETASSELSNLRTTQQVVDLPLNAQDFTQLVQLAPARRQSRQLYQLDQWRLHRGTRN